MRLLRKSVLSAMTVLSFVHLLRAQDLAPRAYLITAIHSNAITLTEGIYTGNITFNGSLPITGATATVSVSVFSLTHSLSFFGRSANFFASIPYGVGNFRGTIAQIPEHAYRSGLLDSEFRFSVNVKGGPAMDPREFAKWRQKTLIGLSLKVVTPTGQYDPTKLLNFGNNRWAFKPEVGLSHRRGNWIVDTYGAVWFFTTNQDFFSHNKFSPGVNTQSEQPVAAFEAHLSYSFKPRLWASLDGNFWFGGSTSLNGVQNSATVQRNSRLGGTVSVPITKHQSFKFSYNNGAYILYGGNYQNISVAWQYGWVGKPR
ncbi:MAG TPA: transporter [Terriglobales bacterium]|nr:transporter [Terriglobales bacterium]